MGCGTSQHGHNAHKGHEAAARAGTPLPASTPPPVKLSPARGLEIGFTYEAFLSPQQEPGEEEDTPMMIPKQFRSTAPSVERNKRPSRGHGMLRITRDLSRAYVDVAIESVTPKDIVMFHIHCGPPDILGPILVDLGLNRDLPTFMSDSTFTARLTHTDIVESSAHAHGVIGALTVGCPTVPGIPGDVKTIAGMQRIAERGELYFNLHTKGQTYFGEIRGQLRKVSPTPPETTPAPTSPTPEAGF